MEEALSLVKEFAVSKFDESIDVSINLGVDPKQSDQVVRGSTVLPNGTGKSIRELFLLKVRMQKKQNQQVLILLDLVIWLRK